MTGVTAVTGKSDIGGMWNFPSHLSQPSRGRNRLSTRVRMQGCKILKTLHPCTLPSALFHPVFAPVGRCVGGERRSGVPPPHRWPFRAHGAGRGDFPLRRGKSPPPEVASIAFVWSSAQPPPRLPLYAGQCPTPPIYRKIGGTHEERHQIQHPHDLPKP